MASPGKRREMDIMKLMMADYDVQLCDDDRIGEFFVKFHGPKDSTYPAAHTFCTSIAVSFVERQTLCALSVLRRDLTLM